MNKYSTMFFVGSVCIMPVFADSFLTAQSFPKTFEDLSFAARIEVLREGYTPFEVVYDEETGLCISGCAYQGITLKEDMEAVDDATEEIANLIEQSQQQPQTQQQTQQQTTTPQQNHSFPTPSDKPPVHTPPVNNTPQNWCNNGLSTKLPLRYPVDMSNFKYLISSDFGFRTHSPNGARFHPALDISCPNGTPVYATADGVVATVGHETGPGGAGRYINILHENGLVTQYLHLEKQLVKKGDKVTACQQIALSGNSGKSKEGKAYAAHLDYRIRFNSDKNKYVDILCPCKNANRSTNQSFNSNLNLSCAHGLFNAPYKFKPYNPNTDDIKRSLWRVEHGHCMQTKTDLLPDERK